MTDMTHDSHSASNPCVIVGSSINAITTATVLASLGNLVQIYADIESLRTTLTTYEFEHQLHALWTLYNSELGDNRITASPINNDATAFFNTTGLCNVIGSNKSDVNKTDTDTSNIDGSKNEQVQPSLYWLFCPELPESWQSTPIANNNSLASNPTANNGLKADKLVKDTASKETVTNNRVINTKTRTDIASDIPWIAALNDSQVDRQIPFILSGISTLGTFNTMAQACRRPWIYYIPFVFLQDGQAYTSMLSPKLWLMGEKTAVSVNKIKPIQPLMTQAKQCFVTDIATTEFARSAIMSMLATRVSFMNEWSRLADVMDVDITKVSTMMGLDERIGKSYLQAGWGFGGRTLPSELVALQQTVVDTQLEQPLMQAVSGINDDQKELIFRKFWQYFDGQIEGKSVAIWGASYKPQSGRTTGAAIHTLLHLLWSYNIVTEVYAMEATEELARLYPNQPLLKLIDHPTDSLQGKEALFILAWSKQVAIPLEAINNEAVPIFDAQNRLSRSQIDSLVGDYMGIGRGK